MITHAQVLDALADVRDPELDEPLTDLGFLAEVAIDDADVAVRLRLPTYFCAPNFAYLMVDDARAALLGIDGVGAVAVELDDHFAAPEINAAVEQERGFGGAFPDETEGGLDSLRTLFQRKAFAARQGRLCEQMLSAGRDLSELAAMRFADVPPGADRDRCVELRTALGLAVGDATPAFVLPQRGRVDAADLERYLRITRLIRVSLDGNAGLCRSLLETRYGADRLEEVAA
jgi:metal-sulfur cluster biosynthetic enzyme